MKNSELKSEIAKEIKMLNFLLQNPKLTEDVSLATLASLRAAVKILKDNV